MPYKRVCKNHRRAVERDVKGDPVRDTNGAIVTTAWPRSKAYPYSSVRQNARYTIQYLKKHGVPWKSQLAKHSA